MLIKQKTIPRRVVSSLIQPLPGQAPRALLSALLFSACADTSTGTAPQIYSSVTVTPTISHIVTTNMWETGTSTALEDDYALQPGEVWTGQINASLNIATANGWQNLINTPVWAAVQTKGSNTLVHLVSGPIITYSNGAAATIAVNATGLVTVPTALPPVFSGVGFDPAVRDRDADVPDSNLLGQWFAQIFTGNDGHRWLVGNHNAVNFVIIPPPDHDKSFVCTLSNGVSFQAILRGDHLLLTYGDNGALAGAFRVQDDNNTLIWNMGIPGTRDDFGKTGSGFTTYINRVTGHIIVNIPGSAKPPAGQCRRLTGEAL